MTRLQVFDPPMCCSAGVCGPGVDPRLARFAADLDWLKSQGVEVDRHNLAQEPRLFAEHELVKSALAKDGERCLPLILVDGALASQGVYPSRDELAALVPRRSTTGDSLYSRAVEELKTVSCCTPGTGASTGKCG